MTGAPAGRFRPSASPELTVVVPTRSSAETLARVLPALARELAPHPSELLLLLDRPTAAVRDLAAAAAGARPIESPTRLGLPGQLDRARAAARGRRLLLLHDDAIPEPGWLESLLAASATAPGVAILGSLQLDGSGRPRRGASLVWPEGFTTPEPLDELAGPADSARTADYVGTASMLIDLAALDAMGGADPRFHPAYYVDVDLCFGARSRGGRVALVPGSRVVHLESGSSSSPFKEYLQRRNRRLFVEKWGERLRRRPPFSPDRAARESLRSRIEEETREGVAGSVQLPPRAAATAPEERHREVLRGYVEWLEAKRADADTPGVDRELARAHAELADL